MVASLLPAAALPAFAQTVTRKEWDGGSDFRTVNLIPKMTAEQDIKSVGWYYTGDQIQPKAKTVEGRVAGDYEYKVGIQAKNTSDDIGNEGFSGGVCWQLDFSPEDRVKINKGDLSLSSRARFWLQSASRYAISIRFEFYDANGALLDDTHKKTERDYYANPSHNTSKVLLLDYVQVPANSAFVKIWFSNWGWNAARPFIGDFEAYLKDTVAPKPSGAPHLYAVNGNTTLPAYVMPGDKVTYAVKFDEAVTVTQNPTLDLSLSNTLDQTVVYSADRQTLYFTTTLGDNGKNFDLILKTVANLGVVDDGKNAYSDSIRTPSAESIPYKTIFNATSTLEHLQSDGNATARYGSVYTAKLTLDAGYDLPQNITVKINGTPISGYEYIRSVGRVNVDAAEIVGDVEIIASAEPHTYTIYFETGNGSGVTERANAKYLQNLPAVTPPVRAGYTFGGYFTERGGSGDKYYNYDGKAIRIYDVTYNLRLYAMWSPKSYTVTLDAQGGTGGGTASAEYDADMPTITKPAKTGYTFLGYFTEPNGGGEKYYNDDAASAKQYDRTDGLTLYAAWSANSYRVTFDKQNGSGGTSQVNVTYDSAMPLITPPTRTGYAFCGYFANADGTGTQYYYANGTGVGTYDIAGNTTLYAKWTADTYDVVLNAQGGSGGSTVTVTFDSGMPVIPAPDKPGYLFAGYFDAKNGGGKKYYNADCSSARTYDRAEGITLYALWTPITYNIQLYDRGENVGTLNDVVYGRLRLPSAESLGITYPNYNFVGWNIYDEQNWAMYTADRNYTVGLATEQGKTAYIYAAWLEKDKYTVTYDANGGEGAPSAIVVHTDETVNLSDIVPIRNNYTFVGWSESSDSTAAEYQPGDRFTMGNSLVTLFAVWTKNPELVYNANGGIFNTYAGASYPRAGSLVTLTSAVPQKTGFVFRGWAESATATVADIVSAPYTMPDHDTVLYAVYEPIKYTVTVNTASGYSVSGIEPDGYTLGEFAEFTVSGDDPKVYINGVLSSPANGVYRFEVNGESAVTVSDSSYVSVIYNANGGINPPIDMRIYSNGDTTLVKSGAPSRVGYTFSGWADAPDSDNVQYTGGNSIIIIADDIVLYAVWEPVAYTVKYDANGGNGSMGVTSAIYDRQFALAQNAFVKDGCQFAGWSLAAGGELAYADGAVVKNLTDVQNGELTLYAVWKSAETTIKFNFEGGSSGTDTVSAAYGKLLPSGKLTPPERYGYNFAGYYTFPNKGGSLVYNADMSLSEYYGANPWNSVVSEFELYAAWEPVTYTVSFVNGTETLETLSAVYGNVFRLPTAETLGISCPLGYTFKGWSIVPGSDTVYYTDGQEIITGLTGENRATVYLYAVILKDESYTVTLPASGEGYKVYYNNSELTSRKDINVYKSAELSFKVCVDSGYTFDKMTVSANGIALGAMHTNGNEYIYNIKYISNDIDVNIYNVRKENFRIILHDGTGYSISPHNSFVENGADFTFKVTLADGYKTASPIVFANGNTLSGVKSGDTFTYTIQGITSIPVISVSVISKPQHTVTFVSNGNIYSIGTVEENAKVVEPTAPERSGYVFDGWYADASLTRIYDFRSEVTGDLRLYAKWIADTYTVEYDKNTADSVDVPAAQTKVHDNVLVLDAQTPIRDGYTFTEWNTKSDGSGTSYGAGSELSVNANVTLYARWKINRYAVTLITGEGVTGRLGASEVAHNETVNVTVSGGDGYNAPIVSAIPQENAERVSEGVYRITGTVSFVATAEAKEIYTASFYFDGGLYRVQSAVEGSASTVVLPNPPTKPGYTFVGWFTAQSGGIEVNETTVLDKNISAYPRFEVNTLNITPATDGVGYTVASNDNAVVDYGDDYSFTVTLEEHYNADSMKVYANGVLFTGIENGREYSYIVKNITSDVTITVTGIELDKYTVTYIVDGQVYQTTAAEYNSQLSEPIAPTKLGNTFKGWSDGNSIIDFGTYKVTSDVTLSAAWDGDSFTVTPAADGVGYTVASNDNAVVDYGDDYSFTVTLEEHYNADNMKVYANGVLLTGIENGRVYSYIVKNITSDITIVVMDVSADNYTVRYNVDGELYYSESVAYMGKAHKPKSPEKTGSAFDGWFDGDVEWNFGNEITADLTLEARFTKLTYQITLPVSTREFTVSTESDTTVGHGGSFKFGITVSDGYDAADMAVYANGVRLERSAENGSTLYFELTNITESTVITVRGIGQNTYSVTYRSNTTEYVGNMPENTVKAHDTDADISELVPERYGYDFAGWSVSEDGAAEYFAGDKYSDNADVTLYAVWTAKRFNIYFETNGGIINGGEVTGYTYGIGAVLSSDVSKNGYTFTGWYENEAFEGVRVREIKTTDYGDKKYYAAYTPAKVNVIGYTGEYDGAEHEITFTLTPEVSVEAYKWYFVPDGLSEAILVPSDSYNRLTVKNTADSGEYYCYIEALSGNYVVRFFTEKAVVSISEKPITVKAADRSKVYDSEALSTDSVELVDNTALADGHKLSAVMTAQSMITNAGTAENVIERIVITDSEGTDVTANYKITTQNGRLDITPLKLTVTANDVKLSEDSTLTESRLYKISGMLGGEKLTLSSANTVITTKKSDGTVILLSDVTKNAGKYTVTIAYNGFDGEGSENYQGSGEITSAVTVYAQSGGGSGGGGGAPMKFTVSFDTDGGSKVESQSVRDGAKAKEPAAPTKEGYAFDGWYSDRGFAHKFDFSAEFEADITLYAKWKKLDSESEPKTDESTSDGSTVADPKKTGVAKRLETEKHIAYMKGNADGSFGPERNMTRAEAAQLFYNLLLDRNVPTESIFNDVDKAAWYYDAVSTLAGMGIINGKGNGKFDPDGAITRAEFTAIAMRFVTVEVNGSVSFADVPQNHWAANHISGATTLGWISGNGDGTFGPDDFIKRAVAAKIVNNMLGRRADIEYIKAHGNILKHFADVSSAAWYYGEVAEAANAHEYVRSGNIENWK